MDFETVIGLEVHVQLQTNSKIFATSSAAFGARPNSHVDPVTFGLPGSLPVLNRKVVDFAISLGLATNCEIRRFNRFVRKHYFYPDLPKGYQISQFEEPICERGHIVLRSGETTRTIGITRIHMEEDAGKSVHQASEGCSLLDLNRAGVPLLEVVSEPDLKSPSEASAYLKVLRQIVRWLGISDGNMEEGSLRCDANISLRPRGDMKYGIRTEIKNLNSFRFVEKALEYEVLRQIKILKGGGSIKQETLLFDSDTGATRSMRGKEESADYRYFPDPDLLPLVIEHSWIEEVRSNMPTLPETYYKELVETYGLSPYDSGVLTAEKSYYDYYQDVCSICGNAKSACNWITSELFGRLNKENIDFGKCPIDPRDLGQLIKFVDDEAINGKMAKMVFDEMFTTEKPPSEIIEEKGLKQITNEDEIRNVVTRILDQNLNQVAQFLAGNSKVKGFLVGQIMKETGGSANPKVLNQILDQELAKRGD